ncbi:hypothetical protein AGMMS49942_08010 [Spirochaetia bacterium]|nr:hypothetical protein AGMMS49942_08010 [Spirochaetia bacterium]
MSRAFPVRARAIEQQFGLSGWESGLSGSGPGFVVGSLGYPGGSSGSYTAGLGSLKKARAILA